MQAERGMNAREISLRLASNMDTLCQELLPAGKCSGDEYRVGSIGNDPGASLRVHLVGPRAGRWCDFATDEHGDALELVKSALKLDTVEAIRWSKGFLGIPDSRPYRKRSSGSSLRWSSRAEALWQQCGPIEGTIGATYLEHRHCALPPSDEVRFHPSAHHWPTKSRRPALIARITDAGSNAPLSLHFTFLAPDGNSKAPVDQPKLLLPGHVKQGGVIRLTDDAEVTTGLGIAEGCETALSVMAAGWRPVWAAIDAGNLGSLEVLEGIECLTVFADNDAAGIRAADRVAEKWSTAGREVRICIPPRPESDWNDINDIPGNISNG